MLWKYGSKIYRLSHRDTLTRKGIIFKSVWQNSDGLRLRSQSRRSGPLCAHTRLSRGDEFRATFVAPSCYFRPSSGMCVYAGDVSRRSPRRQCQPHSTMAVRGVAAAVRMSCTTDLDSISPEHHGLSTIHPPGGSRSQPSLYGLVLPPPPSPSEILGMMLKSKSVLRISDFVVTTAVEKRGFLVRLIKAFPTELAPQTAAF